MAERDGRAVDEQLAAARALGAGEDVEQLVLALALERHDAEHLARVEVERDVVELRAERQAARGQARPGRVGARVPVAAIAVARAGMPSTISPSISSTIRSSEPSVTSTTPTVSPSRRTVARSQTAAISIMPVGDEDDGAIAAPLAADDLEDALGEVGGQGRGHLVEHQDVGLDRERAGEVDDPERGERHAPRQARQVEVLEAELAEPVAERLDGRLGQAQVGADVQVGDERRLLVDGDEPAAAGLGRGVDRALPAAHGDRARVRAGPRRSGS